MKYIKSIAVIEVKSYLPRYVPEGKLLNLALLIFKREILSVIQHNLVTGSLNICVSEELNAYFK